MSDTNPILRKVREWGIPAADMLWAIDHGARRPSDRRSKQLRACAEIAGARLKPFDGEWIIHRAGHRDGVRLDEVIVEARAALVAESIPLPSRGVRVTFTPHLEQT